MSRCIHLAITLVLLATGAPLALGQQLERAAITDAGGTASGGRFEATIAVGEPVADRATGDDFELYAGFLFPRPGAAGSLIFKDQFEELAGPARVAIPTNVQTALPENEDDR